MVVAGPFEVAFVVTLWGREIELVLGDVRICRDVDRRRNAGVARIAPVRLPAGPELDVENAIELALSIGLADGDEPYARAVRLEPVARRGMQRRAGEQHKERSGCEQKLHCGRHLNRMPMFCNAPPSKRASFLRELNCLIG